MSQLTLERARLQGIVPATGVDLVADFQPTVSGSSIRVSAAGDTQDVELVVKDGIGGSVLQTIPILAMTSVLQTSPVVELSAGFAYNLQVGTGALLVNYLVATEVKGGGR